ncbi:MAG: EAL domain-containing protein [Pseudohongiella sp.]|nr:EAL domain-containing protein [Pseudohongiella sp.]MDO9519973.1 EAL domain-containing protein [Pseudohongiella sp.]
MSTMLGMGLIDKGVLTSVLDALPVGLLVYDVDGAFVFINQVGRGLLGEFLPEVANPDEFSGQFNLYRADALYPVAELPLSRALRGEVAFADDIEVRGGNKAVPIEMWAHALRDGSGIVKYSIATFTDISIRKQSEEALSQNENLYRLLAENINDMVCLHQPDGRYTFVSPSCQHLLGYEPIEMIGGDPYELFHPDDSLRIRTVAHEGAIMKSKENVSITYRMKHKDGHFVWLETLTRPILDDKGTIAQLQTTSRDVSERIKVQEQLRHEALHDSLTGLPNRTHLLERLALALRWRKRNPDKVCAVMFLDFDRFKVINDSLGHPVGDELLVMIGRRLLGLVRETDLVARLGGDEFVVLMEEIASLTELTHIARRLNEDLQAAFILVDRELFCSASIGVVVVTGSHLSATDVLRDADIAMYRAKKTGGGRYALFDPVMHTQVVAQMQLENDLRNALSKKEFFLLYQPIVSLSSGEIVSLEVLIRWRNAARGLVTPCEFIPVAEESGLIYPIGLWVLRQACADYAALRVREPQMLKVGISVNLSFKQFLEQSFVTDVLAVITQYSDLGDFLTFEITESMLIPDFPVMADVLNQFKRRGVRISIDDFGTGYSSLSYLHQLPVDTLKVDRSFVQRDLARGEGLKIVETIVALSNSLGFDVIAEGIEDQQQLLVLQQLGCEFGQGFLFARPLNIESLDTLVREACTYQDVVSLSH